MRLGVDVGGTNTDAVIMARGEILGLHKARSTEDIITGVEAAAAGALKAAQTRAEAVAAVMIGTTHFTNALVQRRHLAPAALVRLCLPANADLPPMVDWPDDLKAAFSADAVMTRGGYEFDGRPIAEIDETSLRQIARDFHRRGIVNLAVAGVFSPHNPAMEIEAARVLTDAIPEAQVTLSHKVGSLGLLARENAALINAALRPAAADLTQAIGEGLTHLGVSAPAYVTQNDGSLMPLARMAAYPVSTFASGPANSVLGGAFLSGLADAVIVDIGGTTTDVGVVRQGAPVERAVASKIGGVFANVRMPDLISVYVGGGSVVTTQGGVSVGPESVGSDLERRALCFGGDMFTATDIAVGVGRAALGEAAPARALGDDLLQRADAVMQHAFAAAIDAVRVTPDPLPIVIVGGGRILAAPSLESAGPLVVPEHGAAANAIGAASAPLSAEAERIVSFANAAREEAVSRVSALATQAVVAAGARPESVRTVDVLETPVTYADGAPTRVRVRVIGDLAVA